MATAAEKREPPFIVILGERQDDEVSQYIDSLNGSPHWVETLDEVRQEDFQYVVDLDGSSAPWIKVDLSLLSIPNARTYGEIAAFGEEPSHHGFEMVPTRSVSRRPGNAAHNFHYLASAAGPELSKDFQGEESRLHASLAPLVEHSILKNLERGGSYSVLSGLQVGRGSERIDLVGEKDGSPIAAILLDANSMHWFIPEIVEDKSSWVRAFFEECKAGSPQNFPNLVRPLSDFWMTAEEKTAFLRVEEFDKETERIIGHRAEERESLVVAADGARRSAEENDRAFLHTSGDILNGHVAGILKAFGFEVTDMDEVAAMQNSNKHEDLQLRHGRLAGEDWVCIVEVKGFNRGAKSSALQQIQKAAGVYEGRHGSTPSAMWYVVNAEIKKPLDERGEVLRGAEEEVQAFASDGGLVVDAKVLFQLDKAVKSHEWTPDMAAQFLLNKTGILEYPSLKEG